MRAFGSVARALAAVSLLGRSVFVNAIDLDPTNQQNTKDVAKKLATNLMSLYANPQGVPLSGIPGLLTYPPYYWWEAGAMFGQMIEYWSYTGDSQWNDLVKTGMLHQINAPLGDLMPANQSKDEGNDDQLFWSFAVMSAAELKFPDPPSDTPGWLALAQSVHNQLVSRWDTELCNGGMRWQIYQYIPGYTYKNIAANGGLFQLSARLAKYTGNSSYADWANKAYDWITKTPLIQSDFQVNDGMDGTKGCVDADHTQWTYNYGIMIAGSAYMYNFTNGSQIWADRINGFLGHIPQFFPTDKGGAAVEICDNFSDPPKACNTDELSFKGYLARWLAVTTQLAPFTHDQIVPHLRASAIAAAKNCNDQSQCGQKWWNSAADGSFGAGQQMSALSFVQSNLIDQATPLVTADNGGTSKGNPGAGLEGGPKQVIWGPITGADKAGAGILTTLALLLTLGGGWFMIS